jgi:hypothetical protein
MKVCSKCNIEKPLDDFYLEKRNKSGVSGSCRDCCNLKQKEWRKENHGKVKERGRLYTENNKEKVLLKSKKYRTENKEKLLVKSREYREENRKKINDGNKLWKLKNREKILINQKIYREKNKEKEQEYRRKYRIENIDKINDNRKKTQPLINSYLKNKRDSDPVYKITVYMRSRVKSYLTIKNITKKNKTFELVGISPIELKEYLEKKFTQDMSWDNYGFYGWHIDHIIPLSSVKTEEEIYKLCHYSNLQPLWAEDNLKKSNKILTKNII